MKPTNKILLSFLLFLAAMTLISSFYDDIFLNPRGPAGGGRPPIEPSPPEPTPVCPTGYTNCKDSSGKPSMHCCKDGSEICVIRGPGQPPSGLPVCVLNAGAQSQCAVDGGELCRTSPDSVPVDCCLPGTHCQSYREANGRYCAPNSCAAPLKACGGGRDGPKCCYNPATEKCGSLYCEKKDKCKDGETECGFRFCCDAASTCGVIDNELRCLPLQLPQT